MSLYQINTSANSTQATRVYPCYQSRVLVAEAKPVQNILHTSAISFEKVKKLYAGYVLVEISELWIPDKGWLREWPGKANHLSIEQQIVDAAFRGTQSFNLKLKHRAMGSIAYPDYKLYELTNLPFVRI